ncbi:MAG: peptide chain release factor N(5)-glutamine methyltransferase [Firmicutes bacterium]|nr:peptide chain release factor N(5)-glutamine methyltransferase [Bacillota bacterium]
MTLGDYQNRIIKKLEAAEVPCADYEALQLLIAASGKTRLQLLLDRRTEVDPDLAQRLEPLLAERLSGRPLQYILGSTEFMGLEFLVDERVLIPRQDTELTAETAAQWLQAREDGKGLTALDLCTGSGALAVYLKAAFPRLKVTAADISPDALEVAGRNARRNGCSVRFVQSDLFSAVEESFDLIVTNPPYIPAGDIPGLMREVRDHEPHLALNGGDDGLDLVRLILQQAPEHLTAGGLLLMEIGHQQGEAVAALAAQTGAYEQISVKKDLNGLDRMLFCIKI